jgi:hypothetical protein
MRWRMVVIAALAVVLAIVVAFCVLRAADLSLRSMQIYTASGDQGLTEAQQARAEALTQEASGLQQLITPLSSGSLACGLAILLVLGRRRQLRDQGTAR